MSKNDPLSPGAAEQDCASRSATGSFADKAEAHTSPAPRALADVVVVIVNYGTADLTLEAVASVLDRPERVAAVHVVDNASPGGDGRTMAEAITARGWNDRVRLWAETINHGFGRGNNVVLEALRDGQSAGVPAPRHVLLLNPDAQVSGDAIQQMAAFLDNHPKAGAVGARIERPGRGPVPAAFRFPSMRGEILQPLGGRIARILGAKPVALPSDAGQQRVDWVSGAAVMFRFDALCAVGFFDPDFFLYYEETELMWRLGRNGWEVWFLPEARVIHEAGAATGMQDGRHKLRRQPGYWYDSWRLYFVKTRGMGGARSVALGRYLTSGFANLLQILRLRKSSVAPGFAGDFARHVLRPLFGGRA